MLPARKDTGQEPSLSARRAWIEIESAQGHKNRIFVALRKESVDRNEKFEGVIAIKE